MTNKVPNIRFKGFTDDWEQRKLGEIADIIGGGTPSTSIDEYWDGDIDWYAPAEISDKIFVSSSERKITQEGYDNSSTKLLPIGTVLFTSRAGIGKTAILRKKGCTNQGFQSIVPHENELDSYFIYSRSEELKKYGETVGAGSTFVEVSGKQMANMNLLLPKSIEEQQKIGEYFSNLDHLITLHQRKCEQTKELKKFMLQKMFPKKGEKNPEIRFPGFTDDWEQRKLGEVVEDYIEKTTVEDQYPVLTSSQQKGIVLQEEYFAGNRVSQNGNIGYFVIPRGYFAFRSRSDNDTFVFNRNDAVDMGIISYFYPVFKPKGVDSDFLLRRLNYGLENQIKINSEGTGQHVLSLKKFKNMIGSFPSYEEQQKIGEYFSKLDNLITLHQRKCEQLKELKKFMLQNMFPKKG